MVRPLRKTDQNGNLYTRSAEVETAINAASQQDLTTLQQRAAVSDRCSPKFLPSECLVYLIRDAWQRRDEATVSSLLVPLLGRCEAILRNKVPDGRLPNAAEIRENILGQFSLLFIEDGYGDCPDELDYFECRFNSAFRTFRIDFIRQELTVARHLKQMPAEDETLDSGADEEILSRVLEGFRQPPTQLQDASLELLLNAIDSLPPDESKAAVLCHVLGYKEESEDPSETTAATLCGVTGRTIRNRLSRAAKKLHRFKEGR